MNTKEIKEILEQFIESKDYMIISETIKTDYQESFMIPDHSYPTSSSTTLKIQIDLSVDFTSEEQKEIIEETDLEFNDIYYLITYKQLLENKNEKEVA